MIDIGAICLPKRQTSRDEGVAQVGDANRAVTTTRFAALHSLDGQHNELAMDLAYPIGVIGTQAFWDLLSPIPRIVVSLERGIRDSAALLRAGHSIVWQVLREVFELAVEIPAQLVQVVGDRIRARLVSNLRQGRPVDARCLGYFAQRDDTPLSECLLSYEFSESESDHYLNQP